MRIPWYIVIGALVGAYWQNSNKDVPFGKRYILKEAYWKWYILRTYPQSIMRSAAPAPLCSPLGSRGVPLSPAVDACPIPWANGIMGPTAPRDNMVARRWPSFFFEKKWNLPPPIYPSLQKTGAPASGVPIYVKKSERLWVLVPYLRREKNATQYCHALANSASASSAPLAFCFWTSSPAEPLGFRLRCSRCLLRCCRLQKGEYFQIAEIASLLAYHESEPTRQGAAPQPSRRQVTDRRLLPHPMEARPPAGRSPATPARRMKPASTVLDADDGAGPADEHSTPAATPGALSGGDTCSITDIGYVSTSKPFLAHERDKPSSCSPASPCPPFCPQIGRQRHLRRRRSESSRRQRHYTAPRRAQPTLRW